MRNGTAAKRLNTTAAPHLIEWMSAFVTFVSLNFELPAGMIADVTRKHLWLTARQCGKLPAEALHPGKSSWPCGYS